MRGDQQAAARHAGDARPHNDEAPARARASRRLVERASQIQSESIRIPASARYSRRRGITHYKAAKIRPRYHSRSLRGWPTEWLEREEARESGASTRSDLWRH